MTKHKNGESLAEGMAILIVVLIVVYIWLMIKLYELVIRQLVQQPKCWTLWTAVVFHGLMSLAWLFGWDTQHANILNGLYTLSTISLWVTAKAVELYYAPLAEENITYDSIKQAMFHEPWWSLKAS